MKVISRALTFFTVACLAVVCVKCQELENDSQLIKKLFSVVSECAHGESCVRFCCKNESSCADPGFFDLSRLEEAKDLDSNYKIIKGMPPCAEIDDVYPHDSEWKFSRVIKVFR